MQWSRQGRPDCSLDETLGWIRLVAGSSSSSLGCGEDGDKNGHEDGDGDGNGNGNRDNEKKEKPITIPLNKRTKGKGAVFAVREHTQPQPQPQPQPKRQQEDDSKIIATVGIHETESPFVPGKTQFELGYMFARKVWGKGFASEAVEGTLRWWFEEFQGPRDGGEREDKKGEKSAETNKVYAIVAKANGASLRVLEKCGFQIIGGGVDGEESGLELVEFCISCPESSV